MNIRKTIWTQLSKLRCGNLCCGVFTGYLLCQGSTVLGQTSPAAQLLPPVPVKSPMIYRGATPELVPAQAMTPVSPQFGNVPSQVPVGQGQETWFRRTWNNVTNVFGGPPNVQTEGGAWQLVPMTGEMAQLQSQIPQPMSGQWAMPSPAEIQVPMSNSAVAPGVYAGPPAYRWYGWGSTTPGANPYSPTGQSPKASATWYTQTGATPGAFPVPVQVAEPTPEVSVAVEQPSYQMPAVPREERYLAGTNVQASYPVGKSDPIAQTPPSNTPAPGTPLFDSIFSKRKSETTPTASPSGDELEWVRSQQPNLPPSASNAPIASTPLPMPRRANPTLAPTPIPSQQELNWAPSGGATPPTKPTFLPQAVPPSAPTASPPPTSVASLTEAVRQACPALVKQLEVIPMGANQLRIRFFVDDERTAQAVANAMSLLPVLKPYAVKYEALLPGQ